jgi:hypothetical protein
MTDAQKYIKEQEKLGRGVKEIVLEAMKMKTYHMMDDDTPYWEEHYERWSKIFWEGLEQVKAAAPN